MSMFSFFPHGSHFSRDILFYDVIKRQMKHMFSFKSSHRRCSVKKVFWKISQISQESTYFLEYLFWKISANDCFCSFSLMAPVSEFLLNKFASLQICNSNKKRLQRRCFPVKFAKFLGTLILKNICERLLL